jgi:cell cycle protein kinase DBF2
VDGQGHVKLTDFGLATGSLDPQRIESLRHKLDRVKNNEPIVRSTLERRSQFASMRKQDPRFVSQLTVNMLYANCEIGRFCCGQSRLYGCMYDLTPRFSFPNGLYSKA